MRIDGIEREVSRTEIRAIARACTRLQSAKRIAKLARRPDQDCLSEWDIKALLAAACLKMLVNDACRINTDILQEA